MSAERHIEKLREGLVRNLTLDFLDDDEVAAILGDIESLDKRLTRKALALSLSLSHASSSLVANVLKRVRRVSQYLSFAETERWMTHAFDLLDSRGIDAFMQFVSRTDEASLREFGSPGGLLLEEVAPALETYLRGLSGLDVKISPDRETYSDVSTVFLPCFLDRFGERSKNFLLLKINVAHKWAQIVRGSLNPGEEIIREFLGDGESDHPDLEDFFNNFPEREFALDLYNLLEAFRLEAFLTEELPALMREAGFLKAEFFEERPVLKGLPEKAALIEGLYQYYLSGTIKGAIGEPLGKTLRKIPILKKAGSPRESMIVLSEVCSWAGYLRGMYESVGPFFFGTIRPEKVSRNLKAQREAYKKRIEKVVTGLINMPEFDARKRRPRDAGEKERPLDPQKEYLLIKGRLIELDEELKRHFEEKMTEPGGVLVKGSEMGAGSPLTLADLLEEEETECPGRGIKYDEWDYRRGGYRKGWCSLYEHDVRPGDEPFVEMTLKRYGGYVTVLRKKFELLRREPRILRRQKEGDDIDIDAAVEAFSDLSAGLSPGENLFTRLDREERNIAVLFLLDMSGSTKGWVNQAEKESLVLMCEALGSLGDRYAIYGFSGMTRTRCDYYRIKSFEETYSAMVRRRIAGIEPKDYTRMGPPIRHSVHLLGSIEARIKMLITLSDGKPEDWDAYKGDYGIEDTRRALVEAKDRGIHSFCITIDKEASSYLPHMYGEVNYIFIDDVRKLPNRITEIYRRLTT